MARHEYYDEDGNLIEEPEDLFERLVVSILRQQVSMASAAATRERLFEAVEVTPDGILAADPGTLRDAGLSRQKTGYVRNVAEAFLEELEALIHSRQEERPDDSYTTYLFDKGIDKIAQKGGEEAVETVIESKNEKKKKLVGEAADLMFHLMVLLAERDISLKKVVKRLKKRHKKGDHKHLGE